MTLGTHVVLEYAKSGEDFRPLPSTMVWVVLHDVEDRRTVAIEWTWEKILDREPESYNVLRRYAQGHDKVIFIPNIGDIEVITLNRVTVH